MAGSRGSAPISSRCSSAKPDATGPDPHRRRLHGRRQGPKLKPNQRVRLDTLLPGIRVDVPAPGGVLKPGNLLTPGTQALWLEIGFGGGEHLAWQAAAHPEVTHLGVEPFLNGVAKLLGEIERLGLINVRVMVDDARLLLTALPNGALNRISVLFPDPWPKARHHKRRIVDTTTVEAFARVLADGGELRIATDDADYATWILATVGANRGFVWCAASAKDWRVRPEDWPATRYESKARAAGRQPVFLRYRRRRGGTCNDPANGAY